MFASLSERLGKVLRDLRGLSKITEANLEPALVEVRQALMGADVHFRVAKEFTERVKVACLGQAVTASVTPAQMAIKVIQDELTRLLGGDARELATPRPLRILLVGLHGAGKTTTAAKLARHLRETGSCKTPWLIGADIHRPAAIDQLETLAGQSSLGFWSDRTSRDAASLAQAGVAAALKAGADGILVDTAGRLQADADLMTEVMRIREAVQPHEVFLVADAALGQQAVDVAAKFHAATPLTGLILTKLDGDARGGAALSMREVTGVPIRYLGTGEKPGDFELCRPERLAGRILGMGDVVTLVEKAQAKVDQREAERLAEKMRKGDFDLEDFLAQMRQMRQMGPLGDMLKMLPGMGAVQVGAKEEGVLRRTEAILTSMTPKERRKPELLNASRRDRIARGSGTHVADINAMIKQFGQMRDMMRMMRGGKGKEMMRRMGGMGGMGGLGGGGFQPPGRFR